MLYNTTNLRRKDRCMAEADARQLLSTSTHGILCLQAPTGGGYGIPLNYAWNEADCIFMHCASEGFKMKCIETNPLASLVVTGSSRLLPAQFSTAYESVVVQGRVDIVTDAAEKRQALKLLIHRLTPGEAARGAEYIGRALAATTVLRLRIREFCGKAHRTHTGSPA